MTQAAAPFGVYCFLLPSCLALQTCTHTHTPPHTHYLTWPHTSTNEIGLQLKVPSATGSKVMSWNHCSLGLDSRVILASPVILVAHMISIRLWINYQMKPMVTQLIFKLYVDTISPIFMVFLGWSLRIAFFFSTLTTLCPPGMSSNADHRVGITEP